MLSLRDSSYISINRIFSFLVVIVTGWASFGGEAQSDYVVLAPNRLDRYNF